MSNFYQKGRAGLGKSGCGQAKFYNFLHPLPPFLLTPLDIDLLKEAKIDTVDDFQKHVCLIFDEVRIKEDLVYDKHSCRIIGFVNLGNFSDELLELERSENNEMKQCVATNMLVFMLRNLFSKFEYLRICTVSLRILVG